MFEIVTAGAVKAPVTAGNITKVGTGTADVAVLTDTGNLYSIGTSYFTGTGSASTTWVKVADNVADFVTAYRSIFLLKNDGTLWYLGNNNQLPAALGSQITKLTDVTSYFSSLLSGKTIKRLGLSFTSLGVLCTDGSLILSGSNPNGGMGVGNTTAKRTPSFLTSITDVDDFGFDTSTSDTTYILRKNGAVSVAGYSDYGQAGNLSTNNTAFNQVQSSGILKIIPGIWGFFMFYRNAANGIGTIAMMGRQFTGSFGTGDTGNANYTTAKPVATIPANLEPVLFTGSYHSRYWTNNVNPFYTGTIGKFVGCGDTYNGTYHYSFTAQPTSAFPWGAYAQTKGSYTASYVLSKGRLYGAGSPGSSGLLPGTTGDQALFTLLDTSGVV